VGDFGAHEFPHQVQKLVFEQGMFEVLEVYLLYQVGYTISGVGNGKR
jgi:hypothetical protein